MEGVHARDERHEQWLGLLALDFYEAVPWELLFERRREFGELFLQRIILHAGELLKGDGDENRDVSH